MGIFKNKLNVIILVFFVASVLFAIYSLIFGDKSNTGDRINGINNEQVAIYTTNEYIVSDYNTFYTAENIINQFISVMSEGKYNDAYAVVSSDLTEDISKEKFIELLKEFYTYNFSDISNQDGKVTKYSQNRNLDYLYKMTDKIFIAKIKNNTGKLVNIGIKMDSENSWQIVYLEF